MSDNPNLDFTRFVPGFDFLQNLAKGAGQGLPQLPNLGHWVAPTLNVEELDKRLQELKAVHFWLEQNSKALGATIQALEVQKMTLATLQGMNFNMGDVANALKLKAADTLAGGMQAAAGRGKSAAAKGEGKDEGKSPQVVDPMQWWGALTQQFQQIAADAFQDATRQTAAAAGLAKDALKPARKAAAKPRKAARKPGTSR